MPATGHITITNLSRPLPPPLLLPVPAPLPAKMKFVCFYRMRGHGRILPGRLGYPRRPRPAPRSGTDIPVREEGGKPEIVHQVP